MALQNSIIFITDNEGNRIFYPWGKWGKGYISPSPEFEQKLRTLFTVYNLVFAVLIFGTGLAGFYLYAPLFLFPAILIYWLIVRAKVSGLKPTPNMFVAKRFERSYAQTISGQRFALLFLGAFGLMAFGASILLDGSLAGLPLFALSVFFVFRLFVLWRNRKSPRT